MSHGGGGGDVKAEPNLTPMLDLILQLVMFFMMVANFTMDQVNQDINLPDAQSARPMEKAEQEAGVLYLNLDPKGRVIVQNQEPKDATEIYGYLKDQFDEQKTLAADRKRKGLSDTDEVKTVIIIRSDKDADFGPVYNVLRQAKAAGFKKWQLRVKQVAST